VIASLAGHPTIERLVAAWPSFALIGTKEPYESIDLSRNYQG